MEQKCMRWRWILKSQSTQKWYMSLRCVETLTTQVSWIVFLTTFEEAWTIIFWCSKVGIQVQQWQKSVFLSDDAKSGRQLCFSWHHPLRTSWGHRSKFRGIFQTSLSHCCSFYKEQCYSQCSPSTALYLDCFLTILKVLASLNTSLHYSIYVLTFSVATLWTIITLKKKKKSTHWLHTFDSLNAAVHNTFVQLDRFA